jgi:predicted nucleotidyltransferase
MEEIVSTKEIKVLGELERNPSHLRELSRKIGLSHTHVGKILSKLYSIGTIEKTEVGRSSLYEIKKNPVSLNLLIINKKLNLIELLEGDKKINLILEEIITGLTEISPDIDSLILFGSYSKGLQKKSSDLDLFFITSLDSQIIKNKLKKIENSKGIKINMKSLDLDSFKKERNHPLTKEVLEGIPLINSELFYNLKWQK